MKVKWVDTVNYLKGSTTNIQKIHSDQIIRIAGFDWDDTIVKKKTDQIIDKKISEKISELIRDGYFIIFFTNQSGMSSKNFNVDEWKKQVNDVINTFVSHLLVNYDEREVAKFYFGVYVAKGHDVHRKPNLGLWKMLKHDLAEKFNEGGKNSTSGKILISKKSFFCGDAAGRIKPSTFHKQLYPKSKTQKDFSDSDRKFAANIRIDFHTPEELFLDGSPDKFKLTGFSPDTLNDLPSDLDVKKLIKHLKSIEKLLVILVGYPASGKTTLTKEFFNEEFVHVNQDTCKSINKCIQLTEEGMKKNVNIIVDNTNPTADTRKHYIDLAKKYEYHVVCLVMQTTIDEAYHMNNVRHLLSTGLIPKIPDIVYFTFRKYYKEPNMSEGFDEIIKVPFFINKDVLDNKKWLRAFKLLSETI